MMPSFGGNWIDLVFFALFIYFAVTSSGFLPSLFELLGFVFSTFSSYLLYSVFAQLFILHFSISKGISSVLGFFTAWVLTEIVFFLTVAFFLRKGFYEVSKHYLDKFLGALIGGLQAIVIFLFFVSLVFALPTRGQIKKDVLESRTGPYFINSSRNFEKALRQVFGEAANETLNFLTIKPESNETVDLGTKVSEKDLSIDRQSEYEMFRFVNVERNKTGVDNLQFDEKLQKVAEEYAKTMFVNGFFSHVSPLDRSDAASRVENNGISFQTLGENLAYAPDIYIAHQGLMNSPGHRKNILSQDYQRLGVGVIDGGVFGKMFVQLFSD